LLIADGMDIKTVQARLSHAKVSLTLDLYAHATLENDRKAADFIGSIMDGSTPIESKVVSL
jgi:integrase